MREKARLQNEQVRKHAETTKEIFEDVSKTLKEEQKRAKLLIRKELEEAYEEKLKKVDN